MMDEMPESALPYIIGWVVIVTVIFAILLPFVAYVPVMPVFLYKAIIGLPVAVHSSNTNLVPGETANPDGLVVRYDFENDFTRSHQVFDDSGNGNNAIVQGLFMKPDTGVRGNQSLSFSGAGLLLAPGNPAAGKTNVSFSIWFRTADPDNNYNLASAATTGEPRTGWMIGTRTHELWDDAGKPVHTSGIEGYAFAPRAWVHKVITYNGSRVREYLDGKLYRDWPATGAALGTGKAMTLGSWQPFGMNFAGQVDDFRIYDRALSEENVTGLYLDTQK